VLGPVDVIAELKIRADQPPAFRELEGEVAPLLRSLPAGKAATGAEEAGKRNQTVIPVMVAGHGKNMRV
jgi:hypothetical protein